MRLRIETASFGAFYHTLFRFRTKCNEQLFSTSTQIQCFSRDVRYCFGHLDVQGMHQSATNKAFAHRGQRLRSFVQTKSALSFSMDSEVCVPSVQRRVKSGMQFLPSFDAVDILHVCPLDDREAL
jgi:hypothetical protein